MKTRLAAGILIASAAALRAQTGVSGQPGVPTTGMMTPMSDASSSPVVTAPPPPNPFAPQRTSPATHPAATPVPPPPPAGVPARTAAPAVAAPPPAAEPSESKPAAKKGKKEGADFYTPYLSATDTLDQSIVELTARVAARPEDPGLRNDLGNLLARRGFAHEAIDQYRKAARLDREFFLADYNEGLLLEKEGKEGGAISAYRRSIQRKPGFPLSRFHLGLLYEKEGRNGDAVAEYAKALRIDPTLRWAARNPLVVQTRLLYRASLANYDRDLAGASLAGAGEFADRSVWERLQPQRPVNTSELEPDDDAEDAESVVVAPPTGHPAGAPIIGGKPSSPASNDPRRQKLIDQFRRTRPGRPNPAPSRTNIPAPPPPPPAAVEPPPEDENAPNPAMEEPPPPVGSTARP